MIGFRRPEADKPPESVRLSEFLKPNFNIKKQILQTIESCRKFNRASGRRYAVYSVSANSSAAF